MSTHSICFPGEKNILKAYGSEFLTHTLVIVLGPNEKEIKVISYKRILNSKSLVQPPVSSYDSR